MNTMNHKGYIARIEFDNDDSVFTGRLLGIDDIVTFHGESVTELEAAFHDSVEHYLEVCERTGRPAQKPYSGRFALRMPPELHAQVAARAAETGKSINQQFPGGSKKVVQKGLRMHTGRDVYRANVSRGGKRYQLDAEEGGEVSDAEKTHAAKELKQQGTMRKQYDFSEGVRGTHQQT